MSDDLTLWSAAKIADYLDCGRSTLYRFMADPAFPRKVNPGGGHPRWLAAEVRAWAVRRDSAKAA